MTEQPPLAKQAGDVLVRAPELASLLASENKPTVLDVRWNLAGPPGRELYDAAHIPGAAFVDLDSDLAAPPGAGGRHPMPAAADFERAMRLAGVDNGRPVVVYDAADSTAAARAWWLLRYFGHPSVRVLDGGFRAWTEAGRPVERGDAEPGNAQPGNRAKPPAGDFTARPGHLALLDADAAAAFPASGPAATGPAASGPAATGPAATGPAGSGPAASGPAGSGVLLDARSAERFRGEAEHVDPVAGHIPGAVSAPTAENVNQDGTFKSPAELAARFTALGASGDRPVAAYCGSGVTAAHEVLALTLAGVPAALYVGSWSNWITDPTRPIATGPSPDSPQVIP